MDQIQEISLQKNILERVELSVKDAEKKLELAKTELDLFRKKEYMANRIMVNISNLKKMDDLETRVCSSKRSLAFSSPKIILNFDYTRRGEIVDYEVSERFYLLKNSLVEKHDSIYEVQNLGMMGAMSGRYLKVGHSSLEFNDCVWTILDSWISMFNNRNMKEDLYNSIMNDSFELLYYKLTSI